VFSSSSHRCDRRRHHRLQARRDAVKQMRREELRDKSLFSVDVSLCLSRACLGKMIIFSIFKSKSEKKRPFFLTFAISGRWAIPLPASNEQLKCSKLKFTEDALQKQTKPFLHSNTEVSCCACPEPVLAMRSWLSKKRYFNYCFRRTPSCLRKQDPLNAAVCSSRRTIETQPASCRWSLHKTYSCLNFAYVLPRACLGTTIVSM
jgi:hypothetical protein